MTKDGCGTAEEVANKPDQESSEAEALLLLRELRGAEPLAPEKRVFPQSVKVRPDENASR